MATLPPSTGPADVAPQYDENRVTYLLTGRSRGMEKDVVCGMQVDPAKAAATSQYNGKTYYFCAKVCKTKFDANPQKYVGGQ
jgi:YHS domain-containing protein